MKRERPVGAATAAIGLLAMTLPSLPAHAQQPPYSDCIAVPKIQYDAAKKQYLLQGRFGMYVRTGRFWRRYYWFCR
jgi:hypothetical protein